MCECDVCKYLRSGALAEQRALAENACRANFLIVRILSALMDTPDGYVPALFQKVEHYKKFIMDLERIIGRDNRGVNT